MLILQLLFHSRMITIDHMYALHHCCQHNLHVMSLPQIQITTHLHESGPKAPTCPSSITTLILLSGLRNFSHNHPGGELNKTEGTSSVQVPSLSYSREQNHTGGLKRSNPSRDLTCLCGTVGQNTISPDHLLTLASGPGSCNLHSSMLFFAFRCCMA